MCVSVIKRDLDSGIPPRANYGGVSLCACHQHVGEAPCRATLAFSAAIPHSDRGPRDTD